MQLEFCIYPLVIKGELLKCRGSFLKDILLKMAKAVDLELEEF